MFTFGSVKLTIMIQRSQTIWLLLAAAAAFLTLKLAFYTGNIVPEGNAIKQYTIVTAQSNTLLLISSVATGLLALISIFLFKDRKTQVKLSIAGVVIAVVLIILYFTEIKKFQSGRFALTSIYVAGILIGYIMATRGILKDEKLVKSLNKLR